MSDRYRSWPGAPKQWVVVPDPRPSPPRVVAAGRAGGGAGLALGVLALMALAGLTGPGSSVTHLDDAHPGPPTTIVSSSR